MESCHPSVSLSHFDHCILVPIIFWFIYALKHTTCSHNFTSIYTISLAHIPNVCIGSCIFGAKEISYWWPATFITSIVCVHYHLLSNHWTFTVLTIRFYSYNSFWEVPIWSINTSRRNKLCTLSPHVFEEISMKIFSWHGTNAEKMNCFHFLIYDHKKFSLTCLIHRCARLPFAQWTSPTSKQLYFNTKQTYFACTTAYSYLQCINDSKIKKFELFIFIFKSPFFYSF